MTGGDAPRRRIPSPLGILAIAVMAPGVASSLLGASPAPVADQAAEGYRAMDERRAIKVLLHP